MEKTVEIIYVTHDRLYYTKKTLPVMIENAGHPFKLTIVDNNSQDGTVEYLKQYENHPYIKAIIYNKENRGLSSVTNDFWKNADCDYVGKVDNDTLLPKDWLKNLLEIQEKNSHLKMGVIGGIAFRPEDVPLTFVKEKLIINSSVVRMMHIGGCCYIVRKSVIDTKGFLGDTDKKIHGWTRYQCELTTAGYINGYTWPLMYVDHMDDPRSDHFDQSEDNIKRMEYVMSLRGIKVPNGDWSQVVRWIHTSFKNGSIPSMR